MPLGSIFERKNKGQLSDGKDDKDNLKGSKFKIDGQSVIVQSKLAEGGFAVVYKVVTDDKRSRHLALKRQFVNEDDPRQIKAVRRECEIVRAIGGHKNIVTFIACTMKQHANGVKESLLLTDYYANSVLALMNVRLQRNEWLSLNEVLSILCDMCEAVAMLHQMSPAVVHRDLKVENILIDDKVRPVNFVLCDFGSATDELLKVEKNGSSTVEEEIVRYTTLSYRAPEMIDFYNNHEIHTKADIWALGVMLYKLCYFTLPFGDSTLAIQNATFTVPESPEYPRELHALMRYILDPVQDRRPDIYQVASVAFKLTGRTNPVKNTKMMSTPKLEHIMHLLEQRFDQSHMQSAPILHLEQPKVAEQVISTEAEDSLSTQCVSTSIAPRMRPKPTTPLALRRQTQPTTVSYQRQQPETGQFGFTELYPASTNPFEQNFVPTVSNVAGTQFQRTLSGSSGQSHRRNYSDTTGIRLPTAVTSIDQTEGSVTQSSDSKLQGMQTEAHAFKPYKSSMTSTVSPQPGALSARPVQKEPCKEQFLQYFPPANEFVSKAQSAVDLRQSQVTVPPAMITNRKDEEQAPVDDWNPFEAAPFTLTNRNGTSSAKVGTYVKDGQCAQSSSHFEIDPFGAAPFRPSPVTNRPTTTSSSQLTLQASTDDGGSAGKPTPTTSMHESLHQESQQLSIGDTKVVVGRSRYRKLYDRQQYGEDRRSSATKHIIVNATRSSDDCTTSSSDDNQGSTTKVFCQPSGMESAYMHGKKNAHNVGYTSHSDDEIRCVEHDGQSQPLLDSDFEVGSFNKSDSTLVAVMNKQLLNQSSKQSNNVAVIRPTERMDIALPLSVETPLRQAEMQTVDFQPEQQPKNQNRTSPLQATSLTTEIVIDKMLPTSAKVMPVSVDLITQRIIQTVPSPKMCPTKSPRDHKTSPKDSGLKIKKSSKKAKDVDDEEVLLAEGSPSDRHPAVTVEPLRQIKCKSSKSIKTHTNSSFINSSFQDE